MEEKKPEENKEKEKLPINYMTNEFMNQQLTTLNKLKEKKKNGNDANANGGTTS